MSKLKSLILLYKKVTFLIFILFFLAACSIDSLYDANINNYSKNIYVYPIDEEIGMFLGSQFKSFFPNQDINTTQYILKSNISIKENLHLTDKYGFATQGELWITLFWEIIDKNNKVFIASYNFIPAYYYIIPSNYATQNNKEKAINLAIKYLAKNVSFKIISLLKQNNGNFNNILENYTQNNSPPIYNENTNSKD